MVEHEIHGGGDGKYSHGPPLILSAEGTVDGVDLHVCCDDDVLGVVDGLELL